MICGQLVIFFVVRLQFYICWLSLQIGNIIAQYFYCRIISFYKELLFDRKNNNNFELNFRYWAVTQVNYIHQRNFRTIGTMILLIWLTSVIVSLAPLMGWKDDNFLRRINEDKICMVRLSSLFICYTRMYINYNYV